MRTLWRLLLRGRGKSWISELDLYRWRDRFNRDGLTNALRMELRDLLTPRVSLREPYHLGSDEEEGQEAAELKDLVEWEIVLSTENVHDCYRQSRIDPVTETSLTQAPIS